MGIPLKLAGILLFFLIPSKGYAYLQFDRNCLDAYKKIWNLELKSGRTLIGKERAEHPENSLTALLDNYGSFFLVFSTEEKSNYSLFKKDCSRNLEILEKESNLKSPLYLFSKAQIHFQSGILRAKFQDYWSSAFEFRTAYIEFQKNKTAYPNFRLNDVYLGIIESILGNLPSNLKFILPPLGLTGNLEGGMKKIEAGIIEVQKSDFNFYYSESVLYYTYLCSSLTPNRKSYEELNAFIIKVPENCLLRIYVSSWVAMKKNKNDNAISLLSSGPLGKDYSSFHILDYLLGVAYLNRLDSQALKHFNLFLSNSKSPNLKQDTYLRLSWAYHIFGKEDLAKKYLMAIPSLNSEPLTEKDKQAIRESSQGIPNKGLLQARLLFDGGYFITAINQLNSLDSASLRTFKDQIEYLYRKGRILESESEYKQAIYYYKLTKKLGSHSSLYFAANSSLHLGIIYEKMNHPDLAKNNFEDCFKFSESEYKSSIDQEAQNGLNRLK